MVRTRTQTSILTEPLVLNRLPVPGDHGLPARASKRRIGVHVVPATDGSLILSRLVAALLLFLAFPVLVMIALLVKLTSVGPAFYSQERVGRYGKVFRIVKFRTMIVGAEDRTGPVLARKQDPRVTWFGKILRATHLDEVPQLWNVMQGDMTFIGPRPERPEFVSDFSSRIPDYARRHLVRPGITGMAQILLPYDAKPEQKLTFDLTYGDSRRDLKLDLWIIKETALKMLRALVPIRLVASRVQAYPSLVASLLKEISSDRALPERIAAR